jgi:DNA adenine methylase
MGRLGLAVWNDIEGVLTPAQRDAIAAGWSDEEYVALLGALSHFKAEHPAPLTPAQRRTMLNHWEDEFPEIVPALRLMGWHNGDPSGQRGVAAAGRCRGGTRHPTAEVRAALNDAFGRASLAVWDDLKDHLTPEEDAAQEFKTDAQFIHMIGHLGPLNPDFPIAVTPALRANALGRISTDYPMLLKALRRRGWLDGDPRTRPSSPIRLGEAEEGDSGRGRLHGHLMGSGLGKYATSMRMCGCGPTGEQIKPFFCRMGSKYALRNKIVPMIPDHTTYVEPFAGSAAIFFSKPKAAKNVLNDLDKNTAEGLRLLKQAPLELSAYPEATSVAAAKALITKPARTVGQKIALKLIKACNGFMGGLPISLPKQVYNAPSIHRKIKHMATYKDKLSGAKILSQDYATVIRNSDSPSTFFFIDPPYENTDTKMGYAEDKGFDFERLATVLKGIKGKFLMTINDSPRIRETFKGFKQKTFVADTNLNGVNHTTAPGKKGYIRRELFISNY